MTLTSIRFVQSLTLRGDLGLDDVLAAPGNYDTVLQELKNQFISLLMSVQQKRRDLAAEKKRSLYGSSSSVTSSGGIKKSNSSNGIVPGTVSNEPDLAQYLYCICARFET